MYTPARTHVPRSCVGMLHTLEFALSFTAWARSLTTPITWQAIAARWDVHRSTAYRLIGAWKAFEQTEQSRSVQ